MENFPNLLREKVTGFQEAQGVSKKITPKRPTPRHFIIKMVKFKDKERILKAVREKQIVTYKEAMIKLSADFSTETLQVRRESNEIFQVMKSKACNKDYSGRVPFKMEGGIKNSPDKKQ